MSDLSPLSAQERTSQKGETLSPSQRSKCDKSRCRAMEPCYNARRLKPAPGLSGFEQVGVVSLELTKTLVDTTLLGELDRAFIVPRMRADPIEP